MRLKITALSLCSLAAVAAGLLGGDVVAVASGPNQDCCPCVSQNGEHYFNLCQTCESSEPPFDCKVCDDVHYGCHANKMSNSTGFCGDHTHCAIVVEDQDELEALLAALAQGNEMAAVQHVSSHGIPRRLIVNHQREALQLLDCSESMVVAHYALSAEAMAAIVRTNTP